MNSINIPQYLEACCEIAGGAGELLMRYFKGEYQTRHKGDKSPVTDADLAANAYIGERLLRLAPDIPVIAEEDETLNREENSLFWLVDPLDGTKSFVEHVPEFSVNIGLIKNRRPILGVIGAPPQGVVYFGALQHGTFRKIGRGKPERIFARAQEGKPVVTRSRSYASAATAAYLKNLDVETVLPMSSAVKFCLIAEGQADIYPRLGRTMEWDTAAGHAILDAAGGRVETMDGKPLMYGKPGFENPPFIAYGKSD